MTLDEIRDEIRNGYPTMTQGQVRDNLATTIWETGRLWDENDGVDPAHCRGKPPRLGTPNHRSMTYKLRKVAGYSYP